MRISDWSSDVCSSDLKNNVSDLISAIRGTTDRTFLEKGWFPGHGVACRSRRPDVPGPGRIPNGARSHSGAGRGTIRKLPSEGLLPGWALLTDQGFLRVRIRRQYPGNLPERDRESVA